MLLMWGERPECLVEEIVLPDWRELLRSAGEYLRDDARDVLYWVDLVRGDRSGAIERVEAVVWVRELQLVGAEVRIDGVHDARHVQEGDAVGRGDHDEEREHPWERSASVLRTRSSGSGLLVSWRVRRKSGSVYG